MMPTDPTRPNAKGKICFATKIGADWYNGSTYVFEGGRTETRLTKSTKKNAIARLEAAADCHGSVGPIACLLNGR